MTALSHGRHARGLRFANRYRPERDYSEFGPFTFTFSRAEYMAAVNTAASAVT
jgi:hypothetical protein